MIRYTGSYYKRCSGRKETIDLWILNTHTYIHKKSFLNNFFINNNKKKVTWMDPDHYQGLNNVYY